MVSVESCSLKGGSWLRVGVRIHFEELLQSA